MAHTWDSVYTHGRTGDAAVSLASRGMTQSLFYEIDDFRRWANFRRQTINHTAASRQSQALSAMGRGALGQYFALTHPRPVSIKPRLDRDLGRERHFAL